MGRVFDGMLPGGTETGADVLACEQREIHGVQSTFTSADRRMSWVGKRCCSS